MEVTTGLWMPPQPAFELDTLLSAALWFLACTQPFDKASGHRPAHAIIAAWRSARAVCCCAGGHLCCRRRFVSCATLPACLLPPCVPIRAAELMRHAAAATCSCFLTYMSLYICQPACITAASRPACIIAWCLHRAASATATRMLHPTAPQPALASCMLGLGPKVRHSLLPWLPAGGRLSHTW